MALANFTKDGNPKTLEALLCSAELSGGAHNQLICVSVLNIFLSITAFLGNTLILVALHKETSLHPPSKFLYRTLAATDVCVGVIAEPFVVTYLMSVVNERWDICRLALGGATITGYILCAVSLMTVTAISVDRLLALLLGLRYRQVVTLKRTYLTVTVFWVVSIVGAPMYMYFWNNLITLWCSHIIFSLCLVISILSYAKIILALRHHQIQVQDHVHQEQPNQAIPLNIARYRKAVSSALWLQLALVACYLPYGILTIVGGLIHRGLSSSSYIAWEFTLTLIYLNSSLNPAVYCWKIREVRQAVKETIRQLCFSSS